MRIRTAETTDLQPVYALMCALEDCALPEAAFAEIYAADLARPAARYLVAELDGAVRGFVSLHMARHLHHAALVGELRELAVEEPYRGRGIGRELLLAARREARAAGCVQLGLSCGFRRARAHAFYERNGWKKDHYHFTYQRLQEDSF